MIILTRANLRDDHLRFFFSIIISNCMACPSVFIADIHICMPTCNLIFIKMSNRDVPIRLKKQASSMWHDATKTHTTNTPGRCECHADICRICSGQDEKRQRGAERSPALQPVSTSELTRILSVGQLSVDVCRLTRVSSSTIYVALVAM